VETATVAGALQSVDDRVHLEFREISERERERFFDFSADGEAPVGRAQFAGFVHVIAHEEVRNRRQPRVEILDRRFEIDEAEGSNDHSIFAGDLYGTALRSGQTPGEQGGSGAGSEGSARYLEKCAS
jgi:hypothetical protein